MYRRLKAEVENLVIKQSIFVFGISDPGFKIISLIEIQFQLAFKNFGILTVFFSLKNL